MKRLGLQLIILTVFAMTGCGQGTSTTLSSLADTSWALQKYGPSSQLLIVPDNVKITLNFRGLGGYDGSTGPNNYGRQCRIEGNQIRVNAITETTNLDPLGAVYLDLLRQAQTYEASSDKLIIYCLNLRELVFVHSPQS